MTAVRPVLVVDDDLDIRETLCLVLEDAGYPVYLAENGQEALDLLKKMPTPPGLILLDLMMPVMSGYETLRALAETEAYASIPVTVVTASGARKPKGATGLLAKPLDLDVLLALAARTCRS